jgi:regulator of sirC expression with transglutaminase-like and TPR domain
MELAPEHVKLDCAALHIARDAYPYVNVPAHLQQLDELADEVAARRPGLDATQRYEALRDVLVHEHEFFGNQRDYFDPDNSYLNRVLERRLGIPLSLSVIWLEVARRLKWPVAGVGFPGHFLVRFDDPERLVLADPFSGGRSLSLDDCRKLAREHLGPDANLRPEHLAPLDTRGILVRALQNLRGIYLSTTNWPRLAQVLCRLIAIEPDNGHHLCELAALHARLGDMRRAYAHLAVYLERLPDGDQSKLVRDSMTRLEAAISALN